MLNVLILMGRLTKDPELYRTEAGSQIVNFDLAVDNLGKDSGTTFLTCKCFEKVAENVSKFCHKGSKVALNGRIQQRNFLRKDGTKGSTYEVICDSVEFLDPKPVEETDPVFDEEIEEVQEPQQPKYDPMTGKPLKPKKK